MTSGRGGRTGGCGVGEGSSEPVAEVDCSGDLRKVLHGSDKQITSHTQVQLGCPAFTEIFKLVEGVRAREAKSLHSYVTPMIANNHCSIHQQSLVQTAEKASLNLLAVFYLTIGATNNVQSVLS